LIVEDVSLMLTMDVAAVVDAIALSQRGKSG
jgi:hypothetical protein